ncbi:low temperature requirement protein A [Tropicimonas sp. IMCC34043]|uniref:low temperature requirement protein A n=1 Tax=Tropicimonas sp. IMCC34043 TaxID=2248760 RepID=UPI000E26F5AB|nr:low temperature requirement protein A [Tropicimonas sp. IMCC34043]
MPGLLELSLPPRDRDEAHRAATPLELMFDLAAVIAIAAAAAGLHHGLAEGHVAEAMTGFLCSFFMIWWSWMNYTWFASAYDDDSPHFRILSMVIMFGALMLAAGVPAVFAHQRIWLAVFGFVIMRVALVALWLGAARGDGARRRTAMGYVVGISIMQLYWVAIVALSPPEGAFYLLLFLLGIVGELAVPAFAERRGATTWHRHHIVERYGLFNIIVLGECFLVIVTIMVTGSGEEVPLLQTFGLAVPAAIITFSIWAIYFAPGPHLSDDRLGRALLWGYGHFVVFAAGAATGAGFAVMLEVATHHAHVEARTAALTVAVPVAVYLAALWVIRDRFCVTGRGLWVLPAAAALILLAGAFAPAPYLVVTAITLLTVPARRHVTTV